MRPNTRVLQVLFVLLVCQQGRAQSFTSEEKAVLSVIDRFFSCMTTRDSSGMAAILEPDGIFTITEIGPKARAPRFITNKDYLARVKKGSGTLLERYWDPTVRMDSALAVVSCPYDFHFDGVFSHCGLDVFTLVKRDDQWRIAGCAYSMRKEGCLPGPLGPLEP